MIIRRCLVKLPVRQKKKRKNLKPLLNKAACSLVPVLYRVSYAFFVAVFSLIFLEHTCFIFLEHVACKFRKFSDDITYIKSKVEKNLLLVKRESIVVYVEFFFQVPSQSIFRGSKIL